MLFSTSLLAFVGTGEQPALSPRKLTLLNTHNNSIIQNLSFPTSVVAVLLNKRRLCAVLEQQIYIYDLDTLEQLRVIETSPNQSGVAALTPCCEPSLLAIPSRTNSGGITIVDTLSRGGDAMQDLKAHNSAVNLLAWSDNGSLLASASQKGTVIRVFQFPPGSCQHTFRRGSTNARITGMAFTPCTRQSPYLCVASDHGTIHIFSLEQRERQGASVLLSAVVPGKVASVVEPTRDVALIKIPGKPLPAICAVDKKTQEDDSLIVHAATSDGVVYRFRVEKRDASAKKRAEGRSTTLEGQWYLSGGPSV